MSESGIYIRVDKNNVLLEDLDLINRNEWLNGLDKAGLIRTINILCKALHESNEKIKTYEDPNDLTLMFMYCDEKAKDKIKEMKADISFCLKSIKQEMEMSKDSRTRGEMKSCYEILERWNNE